MLAFQTSQPIKWLKGKRNHGNREVWKTNIKASKNSSQIYPVNCTILEMSNLLFSAKYAAINPFYQKFLN